MVCVILSHYTSAYIFFILIISYWVITNLGTIISKITEIEPKNITAVTIALFFALIFFWYGQITAVPFSDFTHFIENNLVNLAHLSLEGMRSERIFMGGGAEQISEKINIIIHDISFLFIAVGVLTLIKNRKNAKFDKDYLLMMVLCLGLLILLVGISSVLVGYGSDRVYLQLLCFLAPAFVIGGNTISKFIPRFNSKVNLSLVIIMIVLIAQFFSATYMVYQICGIHHSEALNSDGIRYENYYVCDKDINGANWIHAYNTENLNIWGDYPGTFIYRQFDPESVQVLNPEREIRNGYIYLRTVNTIKGHIYPSYGNCTSIANYTHLFVGKSKIYTNGGSEIYYR